MQQKTITVVIDEKGNSSVDLDGFAGQGCDKVLKDFKGKDRTKIEKKKAAFYAKTATAESTHRSGRQ